MPNKHYTTGQSINSLSEDDRGDLRQLLRANFMMIYKAYGKYTYCISESLDNMKVDIIKLKAYSLTLHAGCDEHNLVPLSSRVGDAFEKLSNVYDVITKLRDFTSFLECHFFEDIVHHFKIDKTQEDLKYPEKLREYIKKHTVSEFTEIRPEIRTVLSKYTDDTKELVIVLDVQQLHACQMSDVMDIGQAVALIMNLKQSQLLIHNIGRGSVVVTFLIPAFVAECIFRGHKDCIFSLEQIEELRKVSVTKLKCNGYEFDLSSPSGKIHCSIIIILWLFEHTSLHLGIISMQLIERVREIDSNLTVPFPATPPTYQNL